ncbi:hypothetical protein BFW38_01210 [Terasakiispira papahanaumokuakeensis]|uniref:Flagellar protein FliL n=1 Tax=Terasakiispira papahanaumokuakeensis TaxID=197479 RepID=A0A1E2V625_9GAMM|nr:flagellar basal body-associated FliL family protein [Terasakiispira papahanaumokuakeensis]ODC02363.1 hypothetical protein BFW38_01210 [Terasakiispira papahanaumokuakeensis]
MRKLLLLGLIALLLPVVPAHAEEEGENNIHYVALEPSFVTNYGGPGRLKYLKVDVTLVTETPEQQAALEHEMPEARNILVMLFSQQSDAEVTTPDGQDDLRAKALKALQDRFKELVNDPVVQDVLFTNLIYQK